jgi:hypothetical protein
MAADEAAGGASFTRRSVMQLTGVAIALPAAPLQSNTLEKWRMSFTPKFVDLVRNFTTTVGTGNFVLGPPVNGFTSFAAAMQVGETFYYSTIGVDNPNEREVGRGTLQADGTIGREPIDGTLTDFTIGTKTVALIAAAEWFNQIQAGGAAAGGALGTAVAASRTALAAAATGLPALLTEAGREGLFAFMTAAAFEDRYGLALTAAVAADSLQGIYVPPAADASGASGAWVRQGDVLTPFMFGGQTNYSTGNRNLGTYGESQTPGAADAVLVDSRAACQAVLDMVALHQNRQLVADFSGGLWGIAAGGDGRGLVINQPSYLPRQFIGGDFRGIGSGTVLIYVDEGGYSRFTGQWHVRSGADLSYSFGYAGRHWETGLWIRNSSQSQWDEIKVSGFSRWGVELDPEYSDADYNNNIGLRFKRIYANNCGSCVDRGSQGLSFALGYTSSSRTGSTNSVGQRTDLTLDAGHEVLRVNDIIRDEAGDYHIIMEKTGNVVSVFPWVISTAGSGTIESCHGGAVRTHGKDVAGAGADSLSSVNCGATLDFSNSLHGTNWGQVIMEGGGLGLIVGTPNGVNLGHSIAHMHSEANSLDLVSIGWADVNLLIGACSAWAGMDFNNPWKLTELLAPNDGAAKSTTYGLPQVGLFMNGTWLLSGSVPEGQSSLGTKSRSLGSYETVVSNNPGANSARAVQAPGIPFNVTLKYHEQTDRFQRSAFIASLEVIGADGMAPGDAITVTIDAGDFASGIQFANGTTSQTYVVAGGAASGPVLLHFWLDTFNATRRWIVIPVRGVAGTILGRELATASNIAIAGAITSSGGGIGYAAGAGGTVTQATSKSTGVTIDKPAGQITTHSAAMSAGAVIAFPVANSAVSASDTINLNLAGGNATPGTYRYWVEGVDAGSFQIVVENRSGGALAEALLFNFAVVKAVNA